MEFLTNNWQVITIVILVIDKIVALTPTPFDDMIWTTIKSIVRKFAGK